MGTPQTNSQSAKTASKAPLKGQSPAALASKKATPSDAELSALGARPVNAPIVEEVSTVDETPSVNAGQPGFELGDVKCGYYLGTKTVKSEKKANWKVGKDGKRYRMQHKFVDGLGKRFGIWGSGTLDNVLPRLRRPSVEQALGQYIEITYTGLATESLKPNQAAPHTFTFKSNEPLTVGDDVDDVSFDAVAGDTSEVASH